MLLRLEDGETITQRERRDVVILADREALTITWSRYAPGERGPDLHVHREHTDAFYVLEGELAFAVGPGAQRIRVPAGGFVAVPPNVVHSFANEGSAESRWLNMHAPDKGFAAYIRAARDGRNATWDSFDPPADGGLPATGVIVSGPGEGERHESGNGTMQLKGSLPELSVAEWVLDGSDLPRQEDQVVWCYALNGRMLSVHAPDGGFAAALRR
jgi:quercetin dioxygenase-like cupin family protein